MDRKKNHSPKTDYLKLITFSIIAIALLSACDSNEDPEITAKKNERATLQAQIATLTINSTQEAINDDIFAQQTVTSPEYSESLSNLDPEIKKNVFSVFTVDTQENITSATFSLLQVRQLDGRNIAVFATAAHVLEGEGPIRGISVSQPQFLNSKTTASTRFAYQTIPDCDISIVAVDMGDTILSASGLNTDTTSLPQPGDILTMAGFKVVKDQEKLLTSPLTVHPETPTSRGCYIFTKEIPLRGQSGGPVIKDKKLIGVVSQTHRANDPQSPFEIALLPQNLPDYIQQVLDQLAQIPILK